VERRIKDKFIPLILNLPPGAPTWHEATSRVSDCAHSLGITTVDELPILRAVYESNPDGLRKYYQIESNGALGHKSPFGNGEMAKLIAAAINVKGLMPDREAK
jgi:hypothetical protein